MIANSDNKRAGRDRFYPLLYLNTNATIGSNPISVTSP